MLEVKWVLEAVEKSKEQRCMTEPLIIHSNRSIQLWAADGVYLKGSLKTGKKPEEFEDKYGSYYSEAKTNEKNRERYEYRTIQSYSDPGGMQESHLYMGSVGRADQVRIMQIQDNCGNDIIPGLAEFFYVGEV